MKVKRAILLVFSMSMLSFFLGGTWTYLHSKDASRTVYKNLQIFAKVYDIVKRNYVEPKSDEKLVQGAIRGMLDELDPHSIYLTKEEFTEMQADTRGEFGGLGIEIAKRDRKLTVIAPIDGTPAFKAGIKSGDIIAKIEGEFTDKISVFEAVKRMRGRPGTKVTISIRREGLKTLKDITITRAIIKVKSVSYVMKEDFPVVRVRQFLERSSTEIRKVIQKITRKKPIQGMVLDLRNNPGGLLQQAVEIADLFLVDGMVVYTQGRDKRKIDKKFAVSRGTQPNYPMVVLINGGSASASEIVAGALQDHKRAHVMGTTSFGKGTVQNVIPLDDGSGIKLTVAFYYTPKGRQIQGTGIEPDQIVKPLDSGINFLREKDLPGHIKGPNEKPDPKDKQAKTDSKKKDSRELANLTAFEKEDYQLAKAIDYLKERSKLSQKSK